MSGEHDLFQRLKPHCVALAQSATILQTGHNNQQDVIERLGALKYTLSSITSTSQYRLDSKLANYVFFPIAQLLKESQRLSIRFFELCLQCIAILIEQGWRRELPVQLAVQVIILCTRLGEREPRGFSFSRTTEELQAWSFWCQFHIFEEGGNNKETKTLLNSESNFLHLAQTMTNLLDGVEYCVNDEPQIASATALLSLVTNILDIDCQASFLPGFVSKLTKILTPKASQRRNPKVLVLSLDVLEALLRNTMNDSLLLSPGDEAPHNGRQKMGITSEWRSTAVSELKPAIVKILRIKSHTRHDVKKAVTILCVMLLQQCRKTLANCAEIALDTLVWIIASDGDEETQREIHSVTRNDPSIAAILQTTLYDWLRNISTTMQSPDDETKSIRMGQINAAYKLLLGSGIDLSTINRAMAVELQNGAIIALGPSANERQLSTSLSPLQSADLTVLNGNHSGTLSGPRLVKSSGQSRDLDRLKDVAKLIGTSNMSLDFVNELTRHLRQSSGQNQLANFWLLLNTVEATTQQHKEVDDFFNFGPGTVGTNDAQIEEIYAFSLSILTDTADESHDPRLLKLGLRGLALRAQTAGIEFKYELVDALYPVLHTLATPNDELQAESMNTLEAFTSACAYGSMRDLIVENVDYLTNAVALKLNAFDVSPQAPQVLLMMVRLAGPSLLPYLEDTVESIFAALEDYHGYPLLVELLFKVLGAMADEGVKAPQLAITQGQSQVARSHTVELWKPISVSGLVYLLKEHANEKSVQTPPSNDPEPHPKLPWKELGPAEDSEDLDENQLLSEPDPPPPAPKTYDLLFKITELTQHYLPSASPSLRTSLLSLIRTTVPAIARHENSFLPLINTLWPEIVSRLDDEEPYTVASAIEVIGILCEYAGDFMRSRVTQVWPRLLEFQRQSSSHSASKSNKKALQALASSGLQDTLTVGSKSKQTLSPYSAMYNGTASANHQLTWEALVPAMTKIVSFVQISPEMFDDALDVLKPVLKQTEVQQALEDSNADALWLAQVKQGLVDLPSMPSVPEGREWRFAAVVK